MIPCYMWGKPHYHDSWEEFDKCHKKFAEAKQE